MSTPLACGASSSSDAVRVKRPDLVPPERFTQTRWKDSAMIVCLPAIHAHMALLHGWQLAKPSQHVVVGLRSHGCHPFNPGLLIDRESSTAGIWHRSGVPLLAACAMPPATRSRESAC